MGKITGSDVGATVLGQGIYEMSATPYYRLGTRVVRGDRVFKYAKAGATLVTNRLASIYNSQVTSWTDVATSSSAGSSTVYAVVGATAGINGDGEVLAHSLEGGWVTIFKLNAGTNHTDFTFQIIDNTAVVAGSGAATTLTIDGALPYKCDASVSGVATEITAGMYSDVRTRNTGGFRGFVGLPMMAATTTYPYCWLQTWGPTWISPQTTANSTGVSTEAHNNQVVARHDGSIQCHNVYMSSTAPTSTELTNGVKQQHVGFVLTRLSTNGRGTPIVMLQISP